MTDRSNRLIHETSPYLLQHARNPVDWYPWGKEALDRARSEDKPILLSIGYSSCHWCHVMEKESFENAAIAAVMNENFVNIKVDREERPDLDEIYMTAVQVMTGSGGWPMTVFLTPERVPFHAGTYFPPEDRGGMPGFPRVLMTISEYYRSHRKEILNVADHMKKALHQVVDIVPSGEVPDETILTHAYETLERQFDPHDGGFGRAPKFPNTLSLSFLLRYWKRKGVPKALEMVEQTLTRMASGGIYDHLGGGFHRYSVDDRWLIPHFEKMLYDNALLSRTYFEGYQATRKQLYLRIGEEILRYIQRDMTSPEGGFYSTQDADSEGHEGKYFVWTGDEIKRVLGKENGTIFCAYYGVTPQGNFEEGKSVLHVDASLEEVSNPYGMKGVDLDTLLAEGRNKLLQEREKRVRPGRDEKRLTSWNGLMICGFLDGYKITREESYLRAAREAAFFILKKMMGNGSLMRVFNKGTARTGGYSEDYAFFIQALLDLYEATFEMDWLKKAEELNRCMIRQFWDETKGGFFFSGKENEVLITRSKSPYDNAIPSPNSVAVMNLLRLGFLTGDKTLIQKAEQILRLFTPLFKEHPAGFSQMLSGFSFLLNPEEIGIVGDPKDPRTHALLKEIFLAYLPDKILSFREPERPLEEGWIPFLKDKKDCGSPTIYVCRGFTCLPPVTDERVLKKVINP